MSYVYCDKAQNDIHYCQINVLIFIFPLTAPSQLLLQGQDFIICIWFAFRYFWCCFPLFAVAILEPNILYMKPLIFYCILFAKQYFY